jgi:hypothetical protein
MTAICPVRTPIEPIRTMVRPTADVEAVRIGIPDEIDRRAQDHGEANGHHDGGEDRLAQHRPHHHALDDEAEHDGGKDGAERHHETLPLTVVEMVQAI